MTHRHTRWALTLLGLCLVALSACGGEDKTEITDVRERPADPAPPVGRPAADRFNLRRGGPHGGDGPTGWSHATPEGWQPLPPGMGVDFGFRVGESTEATFSTAGGGLLGNVNRWRGQMGLEPASEADVRALPRRPFLGRSAALVELEGTYRGRGDRKIEGAKMLGLVAELPQTGAFLKMVGPAAVVDAEKARFFELAASVSMKAGGAAAPEEHATGLEPSGDPHAGGAALAGSAPKADFEWTAPPEWERQPDQQMRLGTWRPKSARDVEIRVSQLGGDAGGVLMNVNMWRTQRGVPEISAEEAKSLPTADVLGATATWVTIEGDPMFVGLILPRKDHTVFVRMTGPADKVRAEEPRLRAFVESFRE